MSYDLVSKSSIYTGFSQRLRRNFAVIQGTNLHYTIKFQLQLSKIVLCQKFYENFLASTAAEDE